ncbi:MAG: DUF4270 domain-containing protein [Chlorobi bacterium]|nr:DUF4270 domain-containing protein [Chlorobiota bacterium]
MDMKKWIWWTGVWMLLLTGCKKDFSTAGFDTIKEENFEFKTYQAKVRAYSKDVERVSGELPLLINLGIYRHPAFGLSSADLLIQFNHSPAFNSINFINADSILFVELRIPFFATKNEDLSTDTEPIYDLDSVYGTRPISVKVYESGYYLYPYDPNNNLLTPNHFYSDFDFLSRTRNLLAHDPDYVPEPYYIVDTIPVSGESGLEVEDMKDMPGFSGDTLPPHFVVRLDTAFFKRKFVDRAGTPQMSDPGLFLNYFRGIYVHTEAVNQDGSFMLLDPAGVQLVLAYRYMFINDNGTPNDTSDDYPDHGVEKIILLPTRLIQHYEKDFLPSVQQRLTAPDRQNGEEKIYVKGDAGAMGVIRLFDPVELYNLRNNDWMINQVNLRLYVDETEMAGMEDEELPQQLYLYNLQSGQPLTDLDPVTDEGQMVDFNYILSTYDGRLRHDSVEGVRYYEFNITRHVKRILRKDSANVDLGLRVCYNLGAFLEARKTNSFLDPDGFIPYGTVLQGNRSGDKPLELIIYYTEAKEED